jgi:hypothetical protein
MTANPKHALHELIEGLSDEAAEDLSFALRTSGKQTSTRARPLRADDIILARPLLPDDENADEMIGAIRRWRREGGHA